MHVLCAAKNAFKKIASATNESDRMISDVAVGQTETENSNKNNKIQ